MDRRAEVGQEEQQQVGNRERKLKQQQLENKELQEEGVDTGIEVRKDHKHSNRWTEELKGKN